MDGNEAVVVIVRSSLMSRFSKITKVNVNKRFVKMSQLELILENSGKLTSLTLHDFVRLTMILTSGS